jgi:hypothetical protein
LLPYFDAYVIGCHPRATLFPACRGKRALTGGQAGNVPVLLVDGVVAGVWHQRRSGRRDRDHGRTAGAADVPGSVPMWNPRRTASARS